MQRTAKQIHNIILQAEKILLVAHQNPDGDALGSLSSLSHYLNHLGKNHRSFCATAVSPKLQSLPHLVKTSADNNVWQECPDVIIVFDSGDLKYAGIADCIKNLTHRFTIINIDHHATNPRYGHYNLVIPQASSTAEVLYFFFKANGIVINKNMAIALLTGLITDTENFTNPGTTINSLKIASELIHRGANFNQIRSWFIKDKTIPALKLWGAVLSRLRKHEELDIIYTCITQADLKEYDVSDMENEGIANFLNNMNEGRAALILKENLDNKVKGSFRTTRNGVDVSAWAKQLGGGGHQKAAGFTVNGGIDEVLERVWKILQSAGKWGKINNTNIRMGTNNTNVY